MKLTKCITRAALALLVISSAPLHLAMAQQRRRPPARASAPASRPPAPAPGVTPARATTTPPTPTPSPLASPAPAEAETTFDAVVSSDSYALYGEIRQLGRLARSTDVTNMLELLRTTAGTAPAPREATELLRFVQTNGDLLADATLTLAALPARRGVPEAVAAIRLSSIEAATNFEPQLRRFLAAQAPSPASTAARRPIRAKRSTGRSSAGQAAAGRYTVQRAGSLLVLSDAPFAARSLMSADGRPLTHDEQFQQLRARFAAETLFIYVDFKAAQRSTELRKEQHTAREAAARKEDREGGKTSESAKIHNASEPAPAPFPSAPAAVPGAPSAAVEQQAASAPPPPVEVLSPSVEQTAPDPDHSETEGEASSGGNEPGTAAMEAGREQPHIGIATSSIELVWPVLLGGMMDGSPQWPEAAGASVSFEADNLVVRSLLISEAGQQQQALPIPFLPVLIPGPMIIPESPFILPAATEVYANASLDIPRIYDALIEQMRAAHKLRHRDAEAKIKPQADSGAAGAADEAPALTWIAGIEEKYKFRIRDDLLATLGNEIAVSLPLGYLSSSGRNGRRAAASEGSSPEPIVLISLKDKDALRSLLPRVLDALGLKMLTGLMRTEKQGDVEITSLGSFAFAFVNNFLVAARDAGAVQRVADAYKNSATLATTEGFRAATNWQPRQRLAQVYISSALLEGMLADARKRFATMAPEAGELFARLNFEAGAITYALTGDGLGLMHEFRLPKSLFEFMAASAIVGTKQSPIMNNEAMAIYALTTLAQEQKKYKTTKGGGASYATLDELAREGRLTKSLLETLDYKIDLTVSGDKFEATATPSEYGKTGRRSFFVDESGVVRGADRGGERATAADEPID